MPLNHYFNIQTPPNMVNEILPLIEGYLPVISEVYHNNIRGSFDGDKSGQIMEILKSVSPECQISMEPITLAGTTVEINAIPAIGDNDGFIGDDDDDDDEDDDFKEAVVIERNLSPWAGEDIPDGNTCVARFNETVAHFPGNLRLAILQYDRALSDLLKARRTVQSARMNNAQKLLDQFIKVKAEAAAGLNKLQNIIVLKNRIEAVTKPIISDPLSSGKRKLIGRIIISIDLETMAGKNATTNEMITFENIDRAVDVPNVGEYDAPHILDGMACFGNAQETIIHDMVNGELIHLLDILIRFLESENIEDTWGQSISYFPDYEGEPNVS